MLPPPEHVPGPETWSPAPQPTPQTLEQLNDSFGLPGVLHFALRGDLVTAQITTPAAHALLALQGAHLAEWQPAGHQPVLFLSARSEFAAGKAIRGGVPVIWPWFGPRSSAVLPAPPAAGKSPSHGFARTSPWQLRFAAMAGQDLHLALSLSPSPASDALGYHGFHLVYELVIGRSLSLRLTVANTGHQPLRFEQALHTYLHVGGVEQASLLGLENTEYLDKRENAARKREGSAPLRLVAPTDRVYLATESTCLVDDPALGRRLSVEKAGSRNTVVWNPWAELTRDLPDMTPEGWRDMLCVESASVGAEAIELAPGGTHTLTQTLRVLSLPAHA